MQAAAASPLRQAQDTTIEPAVVNIVAVAGKSKPDLQPQASFLAEHMLPC
jgi:hypothetical protein